MSIGYHDRRSIPACAGEPGSTGEGPETRTVYPRVCGGTRAVLAAHGVGEGLSPRVRGNPATQRMRPAAPGSIPACAGEPVAGRVSAAIRRVYPRVCGGTRYPAHRRRRAAGLSPRVRGNPGPAIRFGQRVGSIPACAGEPMPWLRRLLRRKVYPRVCGGTTSDTSPASIAKGLSPRVRGNPRCPHCILDGRRSIPACAGEPVFYNQQAWVLPVYPRVCGGTNTTHGPCGRSYGLSPRVRGNLAASSNPGDIVWSIPACAGEPRPSRRR